MIPTGLPGFDPAWSHQIEVEDADGILRSWHILDSASPAVIASSAQDRQEPTLGTVLCVHGNPTWSYLWRRMLAQCPPGWRVIAVDHLGMGYSERLNEPRTLAQRVQDLGALTAALELTGPVVALAHDWGGPIALGWALDHPSELAAVVLTNTAVHQPEDQPKPVAITTTRSRPLLAALTSRTPAFVAATTALSRPALPRAVRRAFAAPYRGADRRDSVRDFVADIPFEQDHRSFRALSEIADGVSSLSVPALLVWGTADPVFSRRYLLDLESRLPHADVQVYPSASHLVLEDNPEGVEVIWDWIAQHVPAVTATAPQHGERPAPGAHELGGSAEPVSLRICVDEPDRTAIVELGGAGSRITQGALNAHVDDVAAGLAAQEVRAGQRVAVLIPPGIDLNTIVYAVWRLGASVVIADAGLGLTRLGAALRGAAPDHVIGIPEALALVRLTRVPGQRLKADAAGLEALTAAATSSTAHPLDEVDPQSEAAVLFTSGATGAPKGVVYTRAQLSAQVTLLRETFDLVKGEGLVAAFAPFALYGPPLGMPCAVPDMDVSAPHTLTAAALAEAVLAVDAQAVFASPAALRNVLATAGDLSEKQRQTLTAPRLVMSAGAPVPVELLMQIRELMPAAATHTPYGMTEVLPVATIDPRILTREGTDDGERLDGVCVGVPCAGVQVRISPLDSAQDDIGTTPNVLGEIVVQAPHLKQRYDRAWAAQRASERPAGWHRTGDVGHLDSAGRLWVQGRRVHMLHTAQGPIAPYPVERRVAGLPGVQEAALVGVGPAGTAQAVVIVVPPERIRRRERLSRRRAPTIADPDLAASVRQAADIPVAAVLLKDWLPVDVRHASKVDRTALAAWAEQQLHGRVPRRSRRSGPDRSRARRSRSAPATKSR